MDSTEDQMLFARLLSAITIDGIAESTPDGIVISTFEGRVLSESVHLHVTPSSFGPLLRDTASASAGAFPDVEPLEAAWRLFLVHLDEAIQTARPGETELVPASYGIESLRRDMTPAPITPEQQANRDEQRRYDELTSHFADRGRVELELEAQTLVVHELDGRHLQPAVRLRIPFGALSDRLRRGGEPDAELSVLVAELEAEIQAGSTDLELRADGVIHVRT
jgi:hypothetical protein